MQTFLYPGSFDPFTSGHLDIAVRAASMCDKLYIAVMDNPNKNCSFSTDERVDMIKKCVSNIGNIEVIASSGLQVNLYKDLSCHASIRGIRNETDLRYENEAMTANKCLMEDYEVIYLPCRPELSNVSSSLVKEICSYGGDIKEMVPSQINETVLIRLLKGKV